MYNYNYDSKNNNLLMSNGDIKPISDLKSGQLLMGYDSLPKSIISINPVQTSNYYFVNSNYFPFIVSDNDILVVFTSDDEKRYISVKRYLQEHLCMRMKRTSVEYSSQFSNVEAYYAGYDHIFSYLLQTHSSVRKYILAGIIDNAIEHDEYHLAEKGIVIVYNNDLEHKMQVVTLARSLGFTAYIKDNIYLQGNFKQLPCKNALVENIFVIDNNYFNFSLEKITDDKLLTSKSFKNSMLSSIQVESENKEVLLADFTIVKVC